MSLKKTIENTLINNLEIDGNDYDLENEYVSNISLESIERCSDYIAQEIAKATMLFAEYVDIKAVRNGEHEWIVGCGSQAKRRSTFQLFEEFIADRYQEK